MGLIGVDWTWLDLVGLGRTWLDLVRRDCVIELVGLGWVNGWLVNDIQS